ncbi:MAG: hypothetical protein ACI8UO_000480 [Verrucomicrobiales bacterium]|jgi:hypothetical protein
MCLTSRIYALVCAFGSPLLFTGCDGSDAAGSDGKYEVPAGSGLYFKSNVFEHKAEEGVETVASKFEFTNRGPNAITISNIDTSCRCLKAEADKSVYQPGESGVIEAVFEVQGISGEVEKSLTVTTDDAENPDYRLAVKIDIPLIVEIEPKMLTWAVGEDPGPKPIIFRVMREKPIHIESIDVSRVNFTGEIKTIEEGKLYHIMMTPKSTAETLIGVVSIETDCEIDEQRRQLGFYRVLTEEALKREAIEEAADQ